MTAEEVQLLLQRYLNDSCTAEEKALLETWWEEMQGQFPWEIPAGQHQAIRERMLSKIKAGLYGEIPEPRLPWRKYTAVAAAVLVLAVGGWYFLPVRSTRQSQKAVTVTDLPPGGNHAVLTVAGGRRIVLDTTANGLLAVQGGDCIVKRNGQLDYTYGGSRNHNHDAAAPLNILTTPRGGQYRLVLPDGTTVWLDAASSVTYPTAFSGRIRQITITGQAYFEVVHNPQMPFEVKVQGQTIRDIGTAFNINAYTDEPSIQITLTSGSVAVGEKGRQVILRRAGQQVKSTDGQLESIQNADLQSVLAWKNGLFYLTSDDIATVMRQIGRWYNVDVQYKQGVPAGHITGEVPRNTSLSNVLKILQISGVHFMMEGKKILVTP
jgi:ferric-dicitrate binding protein FerR (iron transport regulator)